MGFGYKEDGIISPLTITSRRAVMLMNIDHLFHGVIRWCWVNLTLGCFCGQLLFFHWHVSPWLCPWRRERCSRAPQFLPSTGCVWPQEGFEVNALPWLGQTPDATHAAVCLPYHIALQNAFIGKAGTVPPGRKDWEWTSRHGKGLCGGL